MEQRQQEHNQTLAQAIGENSLLLAKGIEDNSQALAQLLADSHRTLAQQIADGNRVLAQILERVVQTTDRTERMTAEVLARLAGGQDPTQ